MLNAYDHFKKCHVSLRNSCALYISNFCVNDLNFMITVDFSNVFFVYGKVFVYLQD